MQPVDGVVAERPVTAIGEGRHARPAKIRRQPVDQPISAFFRSAIAASLQSVRSSRTVIRCDGAAGCAR